MNRIPEEKMRSTTIDSTRRRLLGAAGAGALTATMGATFGSVMAADAPGRAGAGAGRPLRWGVVGTGGIANAMAPRIKQASNAELAAVSSRRMETAREFADEHGVAHAFDSWADMLAFDGVDAVYVATPTSVKEEVCIAAARQGKHVLGEKPFANLPSLQRITRACRDHGVGFMDATHFPHSPRTAHIKAHIPEQVGWPWSVASAFQFGLTDPENIRMNPELEPYGAIGDAGWYNMRAAVEYLAEDVEIASVYAVLRRGGPRHACVSGSGVLVFSDGSTTTWNCGFESGAGIMDLRITGARGVIKLDDFLRTRPGDRPADYEYRQSWNDSRFVEVPFEEPESTLMFEDFAAMVGDPGWMARSIRASERTQNWLDAVWENALENEIAAG
ncbi:MAG TPA: Gfo/Idh/MocA family oxidoreductase [Xanthomonadales bacterium]|nr:Gfo/Idh/MocA family oxidoreductase [Xanthomonadales bacterium]